MLLKRRQRVDKDIFWLAGFLEGEGSFYLNKNLRSTSPSINATSTDVDVIKRAQKLLGAPSIIPHDPKIEGRKVWYYTRILGRPAAVWMERLYPLMGERRRSRIKEVLENYTYNRP